MRVLLAIAITLQSLVPAVAVQAIGMATDGECGTAVACCCTGGPATDACAPMQMSACSCLPGHPEQAPKAPPPREANELAPVLALAPNAVAIRLPEPVRHAARPAATARRGSTHNEVQALLCVWRT